MNVHGVRCSVALPMAVCGVMMTLPVAGQTNESTAPTVFNVSDLAHREARMMEAAKANPNGMGVDHLKVYPNAYTLLVVRLHTGAAERHALWSDQIVMLKGNVTLVTGTKMDGEFDNKVGSGESGGTSVSGERTEVELHPGDIAHVAPGVPHWVKLAPGTTATYLIFKEKK